MGLGVCCVLQFKDMKVVVVRNGISAGDSFIKYETVLVSVISVG